MTILLLLVFPGLTVWWVERWLKSQQSHLVRSGAYPNSVSALPSTHYFELCIVAQPLLRLLIQLPHRLQVTGDVRVTDQRFNRIPCSSQVVPNQVMLQFTPALMPGQTICVSLEGVRNAHCSPEWLYFIHGSAAATARFSLLGIARIPMFSAPPDYHRYRPKSY